MAIKEILKYPDPFLREKAEPVSQVDAEVRRLMDDMLETMQANKGVGLAATQVGVGKRILVLDVPEYLEDDEGELEVVPSIIYRLVNPEITESSGEQKCEEGCLSLPGIRADVKRSLTVTVRALNEDGKEIEVKGEGLLAIAIQHEIDHLNGVLFIDHLSRLKRGIMTRRYKRLLSDD